MEFPYSSLKLMKILILKPIIVALNAKFLVFLQIVLQL